MKKIKTFVLILACLGLLCACGSYKDGVYEGSYQSSNMNSMNVEITIKDGKITDCSMQAYDSSGKLKDENYGDGYDDQQMMRAKNAYKGFITYPDLLVEAGNIDDVDAVSGATVSYKEFKEAVNDALEKAK